MLLDKNLIFAFSYISDDYNRVVLEMEEGVPDSDYINASYVDVSFRFRFFNLLYYDALFWQKLNFNIALRNASYVHVSFRFRFSNVVQVNNFQKVSYLFVYHFIEEILHNSASPVWNNL